LRNTTALLTIALVTSLCLAGDEPPANGATFGSVDGKELAFVYFGGSGCGPCKAPGMKEAVIKAKGMIAKLAADHHLAFSTTGVAVDASIERGLDFLKNVGPFDQIVVGREWENSAVLELMAAGGSESIIGIPQIIIYERTIEHRGQQIVASKPTILERIPGTGIPLWVQYGAQVRLGKD
jgi:hypothetical protein